MNTAIAFTDLYRLRHACFAFLVCTRGSNRKATHIPQSKPPTCDRLDTPGTYEIREQFVNTCDYDMSNSIPK